MNESGLLYPLILNKNPTFFVNQCSMWIVQKDHEFYADSLRLMEAWFSDVPKGPLTTIDVFHPSSSSLPLNIDQWYVIDLRQARDETIDNRLDLAHFKSLETIDQANFIYEVYRSVKGLVVYADNLDDIPLQLQSLCVLGMTSKDDSELHKLLDHGCKWTCKSNSFSYVSKSLLGYHRLEDRPRIVYWPCVD